MTPRFNGPAKVHQQPAERHDRDAGSAIQRFVDHLHALVQRKQHRLGRPTMIIDANHEVIKQISRALNQIEMTIMNRVETCPDKLLVCSQPFLSLEAIGNS